MKMSGQLIDVMNSDLAITTSGFLLGFIHNFKFNKQTLNNPLSTIFGSSICGFFTSIGAEIVAGFLPPNLRFLIPTTIMSSCAYYKYKDLFPDENKSNKPNKPLISVTYTHESQINSENNKTTVGKLIIDDVNDGNNSNSSNENNNNEEKTS